MSDKQILPILDMEALQAKANTAAMKGACEAIDQFYSGYNSPFKKQIEEQLNETKIGFNIKLPDIIALINESLSKEIELIANTAVAKSFLPMVQKFLVREEKIIMFSDLLKSFIEFTDSKSCDDCNIDIKEHPIHGWLDINIGNSDKQYNLTIHTIYSRNKDSKKEYQILSLPRFEDSKRFAQTMKVSLDGVTLEMPFTKDVLQDPFISYIARLIIGNSIITMNCTDFNEDMFPQDECNCN